MESSIVVGIRDGSCGVGLIVSILVDGKVLGPGVRKRDGRMDGLADKELGRSVETITVGVTEGFRDGVTEGKFDAGKQVPGLGSVPGSFLCKLSSSKQNKQCIRYIQRI